MTKEALSKIDILLEEAFGYDHKNLGQRYFLNTLNAGFGAKGVATAAAAAAAAGYGMDLPEEWTAPAAAGLLGTGAVVGSHIIGKLDKKLFTKLGIDKKTDFTT